MTEVRNSFFNRLPTEEKAKYEILFVPKDDWFVKNSDCTMISDKKSIIRGYTFLECKSILKDFIEIQNNQAQYDLSYIYFYGFSIGDYFIDNTVDKDINFHGAIFKSRTWFAGATFYGEVSFSQATFNFDTVFTGVTFNKVVRFSYVTFNNIVYFEVNTFKGEAEFVEATFKGEVEFVEATFHYKASFNRATFHGVARFNGATFEKKVIFSEVKFKQISITNIKAEDILLLEIKGLDKNGKETIINKNNFANKESARIIKAHFEKQGNITEANKYFVIEQEKYIDELKDKENITEGGRVIKLIPLYLNKYISNFGTDWVRASLFLLLYGILAYCIFNIFRFYPNISCDAGLIVAFLVTLMAYGITYKEPKLNTISIIFVTTTFILYFIWIYRWAGIVDLNEITKMINPINAFKSDDTFKDHEFFGAIVRIGAATIIYQIIVSFRQFTRRG